MVSDALFKMMLILVLVGTVSCYSTMKVGVDVFDRDAMAKMPVYLEDQLDRVCNAATEKAVGLQQAELAEKFLEGLDRAFELLKKDSGLIIPLENIEQTKLNVFSYISDTLTSIGGMYGAVMDSCSFYFSDSTYLKRPYRIKVLQAILSDADLKLGRMTDELCGALNTLVGGSSNPSFDPLACLRIFAPVTKEVEQLQNNTPFGPSIIGDRFASLIVRAPEKYWQKYKNDVNLVETDNLRPYETKKGRRNNARINKAVIRTFFGNADLAIKMDGPGSFTVKGVRLDADEALTASFEVLQQGIKYLAYANGVAVKDPANSDAQENTLLKIPELADNEELERTTLQIQQLSDSELNAFLSVIFSQADQMTSPNAGDRLRAGAIIQQAYSAFKSNLSQYDNKTDDQ